MGHDHSHFEHALHGISAFTWAGFFAILSFSFVMSLHCAGMCAPLVCSRLGTRARINSPAIWRYNVGRMCSYIITGSLVASIGQGLEKVMSSAGFTVAVFLSFLLLIQGVGYILGRPILQWNLPHAKIFQQALKPSVRLPLPAQDILLGVFTVFLPCMTLTPALLAAASADSMLEGALMMTAFFLGTLPTMIAAPALAGIIAQKNTRDFYTRLGGVFLILTALITFMRIWHH